MQGLKKGNSPRKEGCQVRTARAPGSGEHTPVTAPSLLGFVGTRSGWITGARETHYCTVVHEDLGASEAAMNSCHVKRGTSVVTLRVDVSTFTY